MDCKTVTSRPRLTLITRKSKPIFKFVTKDGQRSQNIMLKAGTRLLPTGVSKPMNKGLKRTAHYRQNSCESPETNVSGFNNTGVTLIGANGDRVQAGPSPLTQHRITSSQVTLFDESFWKSQTPDQFLKLETDKTISHHPTSTQKASASEGKPVPRRSPLHDIIKKKDGKIKELREEIEKLKGMISDRDERLEKARRFAVLAEKATNIRKPRIAAKNIL